ncbi:transmembrane protein 17A [Triplophysa rosa]|uniref:Transmembrane protein 17A n=1 Tax=Triplophysa rosa TaxID=992332 RepID=A0A9W8CA26_TRIRA|nr:transmembrane protein 17A [Triplophysa rosa]KAI7813056.1 putative transmembrane protein 17A [Triplophysa rosa]
MPVFYTPIPQNLRVGLANVSGSVFLNNRTRDSEDLRDFYQDNEACTEVSSQLPLQMLLYFNSFFFPFWWISEVVMLNVKFSLLPVYYQCLLVTGLVLISIFEVLRVYLGYVGNLKEKVPELAGFWLLSFLFQLPILLFFMTDPDIIILPLERAVHSLYLAFLLAEILASFLALRVMTRKLALQFHMRQFGPVQSLHTVDALPMLGLSCGTRSVLPVMDIPQPQ